MDFFDYLHDFPSYLRREWHTLVDLSVDHLQVVLLALLISTVLGVAIGMACYRRPHAATVALSITGTFLTVPSLALFGLLGAAFGLGMRYESTLLALTMYSLLPIVRNTITGLRGVDPAISESATGMGLSRSQRLLRVDLPLAWPVIIAGVRVSMLVIVGIAAIAAVVNGPGLGNQIFAGFAKTGTQEGFNLAFSGTLAIVVLALLLDAAFGLFSRLTTSKGLR